MKSKKNPLYIMVRDYIKDQIESGKLKPKDQIPTEMELMNHFQVSRVTVTAAIKQLVEEGLVYRLAGKGTYVKAEDHLLPQPDKPSTILKPKSTIGFIMRPASNLFTYRLLVGIEEACRRDGFRLLVRSSLNQDDEVKAIEDMFEFGVKGLIIQPLDGETYNSAILKLKLNKFPFVLVDRYLPGINTNAVISDNYSGGVKATEYLADIGHRTIGLISYQKSIATSLEDRFQGYLEVVKRKKLPVQPHHWLTHIQDDEMVNDPIRTVRIVEEWFAIHRDITAIFALQPYVAIAVTEAAHKLGLRIPEDISIVSFDNTVNNQIQQNSYTYIEQNLELIGRESVELLKKAISDPSITEHIKIPISLVEGQSTLPFVHQ
ncbi:GntR family transcriptional regulator [Cohnella silvisoli]|uniref:GntR family transcriptional regulator n=1 Tax=Cohnella silvisoli TaxID=2873699 RepID=A0ABV1KN69_9BACL|nr:GntR family transcriptional regulator [Cohnella silvisoli]MCD9020618.1 GntR family transcriptional regulator [Cohnella silvisoli]